MNTTNVLLEQPQRTHGARDRLEAWVRQRDILAPPFGRTIGPLVAATSARELDAWAQAGLDLANVNVGPTALITFWQISARSIDVIGCAALVAVAGAAADVGRHAGAAPGLVD